MTSDPIFSYFPISSLSLAGVPGMWLGWTGGGGTIRPCREPSNVFLLKNVTILWGFWKFLFGPIFLLLAILSKHLQMRWSLTFFKMTWNCLACDLILKLLSEIRILEYIDVVQEEAVWYFWWQIENRRMDIQGFLRRWTSKCCLESSLWWHCEGVD